MARPTAGAALYPHLPSAVRAEQPQQAQPSLAQAMYRRREQQQPKPSNGYRASTLKNLAQARARAHERMAQEWKEE